uniref:FGENESH: predicted gene_5.111 protein n=1 Tax=Rhodotorula toruloides TaxID=5286 RepID=A0A0K3CDS7_RHOTO
MLKQQAAVERSALGQLAVLDLARQRSRRHLPRPLLTAPPSRPTPPKLLAALHLFVNLHHRLLLRTTHHHRHLLRKVRHHLLRRKVHHRRLLRRHHLLLLLPRFLLLLLANLQHLITPSRNYPRRPPHVFHHHSLSHTSPPRNGPWRPLAPALQSATGQDELNATLARPRVLPPEANGVAGRQKFVLKIPRVPSSFLSSAASAPLDSPAAQPSASERVELGAESGNSGATFGQQPASSPPALLPYSPRPLDLPKVDLYGIRLHRQQQIQLARTRPSTDPAQQLYVFGRIVAPSASSEVQQELQVRGGGASSSAAAAVGPSERGKYFVRISNLPNTIRPNEIVEIVHHLQQPGLPRPWLFHSMQRICDGFWCIVMVDSLEEAQTIIGQRRAQNLFALPSSDPSRIEYALYTEYAQISSETGQSSQVVFTLVRANSSLVSACAFIKQFAYAADP